MYNIGGVRCRLFPFNVHEAERELVPALARHNVLGSVTQHEQTGEADEFLRLTGNLFPRAIGGEQELNMLKGLARNSQPVLVTQGNSVSDWYLITKLKDRGTYLDERGVGRHVKIDIELERTAAPQFSSPGTLNLISRLFSYA